MLQFQGPGLPRICESPLLLRVRNPVTYCSLVVTLCVLSDFGPFVLTVCSAGLRLHPFYYYDFFCHSQLSQAAAGVLVVAGAEETPADAWLRQVTVVYAFYHSEMDARIAEHKAEFAQLADSAVVVEEIR